MDTLKAEIRPVIGHRIIKEWAIRYNRSMSPSPNLTIINLVHEEDGLFTNATLSIINAQPKGSFTFSEDGNEFTREIDLAEDDFEALWSQFNEPIFLRCAVRSPDAQLDFRRNYIIGIIYNVNAEAGQMTYLIRNDESDPTWLAWLKKFEAIQKQR